MHLARERLGVVVHGLDASCFEVRTLGCMSNCLARGPSLIATAVLRGYDIPWPLFYLLGGCLETGWMHSKKNKSERWFVASIVASLQACRRRQTKSVPVAVCPCSQGERQENGRTFRRFRRVGWAFPQMTVTVTKSVCEAVRSLQPVAWLLYNHSQYFAFPLLPMPSVDVLPLHQLPLQRKRPPACAPVQTPMPAVSTHKRTDPHANDSSWRVVGTQIRSHETKRFSTALPHMLRLPRGNTVPPPNSYSKRLR